MLKVSTFILSNPILSRSNFILKHNTSDIHHRYNKLEYCTCVCNKCEKWWFEADWERFFSYFYHKTCLENYLTSIISPWEIKLLPAANFISLPRNSVQCKIIYYPESFVKKISDSPIFQVWVYCVRIKYLLNSPGIISDFWRSDWKEQNALGLFWAIPLEKRVFKVARSNSLHTPQSCNWTSVIKSEKSMDLSA